MTRRHQLPSDWCAPADRMSSAEPVKTSPCHGQTPCHLICILASIAQLSILAHGQSLGLRVGRVPGPRSV